MHRAILQACFPWFLWLLAGFAGLWLMMRFSGARLRLGRLRNLHGCEEGSVQTLSFVLTLPIFMMIVLFIVQVSQLMIGITIVHYAAFAAARAASVWIPAQTPSEPENRLDPISVFEGGIYPSWMTQPVTFNEVPAGRAWKYQKVWLAAVLGCVPIAPSKSYLTAQAQQSMSSSNSTEAMVSAYKALVPKAANDPVIPNRLRNKVYYAFEHTWIHIDGVDYSQNALNGPTYNPLNHPDPNVIWNQYEVGWQDPITVQVWFRFPLLTGPGRFLSPGHFLKAQLAPSDGTPDKVSQRIQIWDKNSHPRYAESVYWTQVTATATFANEGLKSVIPYIPKQDLIN